MNKNLDMFFKRVKNLYNASIYLKSTMFTISGIRSINGSPVEHDFRFASSTRRSPEMRIGHFLYLPKKKDAMKHLSKEFLNSHHPGMLETFQWFKDDGQVVIESQSFGFSDRWMSEYSIFEKDSIIDFGQLFNKMDILALETL